VSFSNSKPGRPPRPTSGSFQSQQDEEGAEWRAYLDPRLIQARELATLDQGEVPPAGELAPVGEEQPSGRSQRLAMELERLDIECERLTRRWFPPYGFFVKRPR
jgi:hypothetical protein